MKEYKLFCGGSFCFDYLDADYETNAAEDYRAMLLGSVDALLRPEEESGVRISDLVTYIGPFYFETEAMEAEDIVRCEKQMIEKCTDAVFILDDAACPGTVTELIYASSLKKTVHIFYVDYGMDAETESRLHTPCWYPIVFSGLTDSDVHLYPCSSLAEAKQKVKSTFGNYPYLNEHNKQEHEPSHTAEHLLNATMVRMFGCPRSRNAHIERKKSKCDYILDAEPSEAQVAEIEARVNAAIAASLDVKIGFMPREKAAEIVDLSKLPEDASDILRIVRIGDYDACACIGSHVSNTSEIGTFKIISHSYADGIWRLRWKIIK